MKRKKTQHIITFDSDMLEVYPGLVLIHSKQCKYINTRGSI